MYSKQEDGAWGLDLHPRIFPGDPRPTDAQKAIRVDVEVDLVGSRQPGSPSQGFVRLTGRELVGLGGQDFHAVSWRHSARAAERFCLKMSRRLRWRSWLNWL